MSFPTQIRQNDTLSFNTKLDSKYDAFTLTYHLNSAYSVDAVFSNGMHVVNSNSTDWQPGQYAVQGVVSDGTQRFTVETCTTDVLPDISKLTNSTSHIKQVLDAIEATILGAASKEQESYEIAGRSLKYRSIGELLKLRDVYKRDLAMEKRACELAQGGVNRNIKVRFGPC